MKRHFIEIGYDSKNKRNASCSCGWKYSAKDRNDAMRHAHSHIAEQAAGNE